MKSILMSMLRVLLTLIRVVIGFCIGFSLAAKLCDWWIVPDWLRHSPHVAQVEQGVFTISLSGGILAVFAVLALDFYLLRRRLRRKNPAPTAAN